MSYKMIFFAAYLTVLPFFAQGDTVETGNNNILCSIEVLNKYKAKKLLHNRDIVIKEKIWNSHLVAKIKITNNTDKTMRISADNYLEKINHAFVDKQEIIHYYYPQKTNYKQRVLSAVFGITLAVSSSLPWLGRVTPNQEIPMILFSGGTAILSIFCLQAAFCKTQPTVNKLSTCTIHYNPKALMSTQPYSPEAITYDISPGGIFEDIIFLDLKRINPKKLYNLSPRLVYTLKD